MVDIRQEGRSQRSASEKREDVPVVHPENQAAGMGERISHSLQLGQLHAPSTWSPELLRPGTGAKRSPNQVWAFVEYLRT